MVSNECIDEMEVYGGSFVRAIAIAWVHADFINKKKLEKAFDYFEEYGQRADNRRKQNESVNRF